MRSVVILKTRRAYRWESMNHVLLSIEQGWGAVRGFGIRAIGLEVNSVSDLKKYRSLLSSVSEIVIPSVDWLSIDCVRVIRSEMRIGARFLFHILGEGTMGGLIFNRLDGVLREEDGFLTCSEAGLSTIRLCYPNAQAETVGYALTAQSRIPVSQKPSSSVPFLYLGRISQQKNLHTLLTALGVLSKTDSHHLWNLWIHGKEDHLGSPNYGVTANGYRLGLRKLCRSLGFSKRVSWGNHLTQPALRRLIASEPHIFVSASLHSDDEFGVAALQSLSSGNRAVLSDWGGHRDLALRFPEQVRLVPVHSSSLGPWIDPSELAFELAESSRSPSPQPRSLRAESGNSVWMTSARLAQAVFQYKKSKQVLRSSRWRQRLIHQRKAKRYSGRRLFQSYADALARPLHLAYGMRSLRQSLQPSRQIVLMPWVRVTEKRISVSDPMKGRWVIGHPFANRVQRCQTWSPASWTVKFAPQTVRLLLKSGAAFTLKRESEWRC